ncbi:MAG: dihydroorotate dehydrogenase electron transfer subunit, partial [Lentisphaerae bacterium]|nr:dihydroorotate dehydrogenase electron transfer subunit [Lentisphaerota bacterium]
VKGYLLAGVQTADHIQCLADFRELGWDIMVSTEDGTAGHRGLVTELLESFLQKGDSKTYEVFSCGPIPMLQRISEMASESGIKAWVSLDRQMGCGIGVCLACVQKVRKQQTSSDTAPSETDWEWARVCKEGPVFECREVIW